MIMINEIILILKELLGIGYEELTTVQMVIRTTIVYIMAIALIRLGKKRFLAKPSSFDLVLMLILGSVISRAITGNVPFLPTLISGIVLVLLHTFVSYITFYSTRVGAVIKGLPLVLIKDGRIRWGNLRESQITEKDLMSALRRFGKLTDPKEVKLATLERNGEISVISKPLRLTVTSIDVKEGVQTVKLELRR